MGQIIQESLANAKVNARQHCVVWSHSNAGNAIWRTTMFHVVAPQKSEITRNSERIQPYSSSRSSKVIDLGVNGKPIYDFLLVINSNFSRIWYRFRDIDAYLKLENGWFYPPLPCLRPHISRAPANICITLILLETTFSGLHFRR